MTTQLQHLALERAHFRQFCQYIPEYSDACQTTVQWAMALGGLQVSTFFEQAVAHQSGLTVISTDAADLSDGSDCKLSTVRHLFSGTRYSAPVTGVANKTGVLRVQVYERMQNQFYYFLIPRSAYQHIPRTSNIEIPFDLSGLPRRQNACICNWWNYEVPDFLAVCQ
jgi:hypothetical protein